ncbi:hypothetical protein T484DRAFT_1661651 [Baffinella frigidus]|nr:hypothetical protein T484DRAFT_1661651 [Cryptophyta sp. CCMP2293]|mmetsp:Transcript_53414/g.127082  ORF Transcript_53414/g.127082 Transcript_53414/m.127082 type:complete len:189 (-) Transcript_53414:100-666(-)|eukprot:CAMPEP_0180184768 /NCGR_PEP_ID=MMETSP0986-20121125/42013_1 /TAXON_ID=697907 /ORGANISM="non described non described, Strain CCMP2293" /LENGTH=188 /DNA_ID=CAMNT_0022138501 /DNA_START=120 /DNA_END=686 /DNA_ORIENTATION=+
MNRFSRLALRPAAGIASRRLPAASVQARSFADEARKFRVLGLQQIAVGAEVKDDMTKIWQGQFGLKKYGVFQSEKENVDEDILKVGKGVLGTVEIDIMAPIDLAKSPKVWIPNLNHIGLWIDDLEVAVATLKGNGVRFAGGIRVGAAGHKIAFVHPKGNDASPIGGAGVLIELVQAPPEVIKAYDDLP